MRRSTLTCILFALAMAAAAVADAAPAFPITNVLDSRGAYQDADSMSMNASGDLAVIASLDSGPFQVLKYHDGALSVVATEGPGGGYAQIFPRASITNGGTVAFFAKSTPNSVGLFSGPNPANSAIFPSIGGSGFSVFTFAAPLGESHRFWGLHGGFVGVYSGPNFATDAVVEADTNTFTTIDHLQTNGTSSYVYRAIRAGTGVQGLYRGPNFVADKIVDSSGAFATFDEYIGVASNGKVAFTASTDAGRLGVFTGPDAVADLVADNDPKGPFSQVFAAGINADGLVAWCANYRDGGGSGLYVGRGASAIRVVGKGDSLFGSIVTEVQAYNGNRLNDRGDLTFAYVLADGTNGLAIAHVPEPVTALLVAPMIALLRRRRR